VSKEDETRPFYYGRYLVYKDGRMKNTQGVFLKPRVLRFRSEAVYSLQYKKKRQRLKVVTIVRAVWGGKGSPGPFDEEWVYKVLEDSFKTSDKRIPGIIPQTSASSYYDEPSWNSLETPPGCDGPWDPIFCPLEQHMGEPSRIQS